MNLGLKWRFCVEKWGKRIFVWFGGKRRMNSAEFIGGPDFCRLNN